MEMFFSDAYNYFIKPLFELVNPLYIALVIGGSQVLFTHVPIKLFRDNKRNTVLVLSILIAIPFVWSYYSTKGFMLDVFLWKCGGLAFNYIIAVLFYQIIVKKLFDMIGYTESGKKKKNQDGGTQQ